MNDKYPNNRVRLKAIGGGGGKANALLSVAMLRARRVSQRDFAGGKASGVGDNKNVLVELNIESTRHQEIQVIGNGDWCMTLGGRDCSLQMHEQKLLEVSVTRESLLEAAEEVAAAGLTTEAEVLKAMWSRWIRWKRKPRDSALRLDWIRFRPSSASLTQIVTSSWR